ncbi:MAG: MBG domain-containing protein [Bacillota bacterium]
MKQTRKIRRSWLKIIPEWMKCFCRSVSGTVKRARLWAVEKKSRIQKYVSSAYKSAKAGVARCITAHTKEWAAAALAAGLVIAPYTVNISPELSTVNCQSSIAFAAPTGPTVVAGTVTKITHGAFTQITQTSQRAAIDWESFNVAYGEMVYFNQGLGPVSATLNRVTSTGPSTINGSIGAPGQVYFVNPNGIMLQENANIHVGGLVLSAGNMTTGQMRDFVASGAFVTNGAYTSPISVASNYPIKISGEANGIAVLQDSSQLSLYSAIEAPGVTVTLNNAGTIELSSEIDTYAVSGSGAGGAVNISGINDVNFSGTIVTTAYNGSSGAVTINSSAGAVNIAGCTINTVGNANYEDGSQSGAVNVTAQGNLVVGNAYINTSANYTIAGDVNFLSTAGSIDIGAAMILAHSNANLSNVKNNKVAGDVNATATAAVVGGVQFSGTPTISTRAYTSGAFIVTNPADDVIGTAKAATYSAILLNSDVVIQNSASITQQAGVVIQPSDYVNGTPMLTYAAPAITLAAGAQIILAPTSEVLGINLLAGKGTTTGVLTLADNAVLDAGKGFVRLQSGSANSATNNFSSLATIQANGGYLYLAPGTVDAPITFADGLAVTGAYTLNKTWFDKTSGIFKDGFNHISIGYTEWDPVTQQAIRGTGTATMTADYSFADNVELSCGDASISHNISVDGQLSVYSSATITQGAGTSIVANNDNSSYYNRAGILYFAQKDIVINNGVTFSATNSDPELIPTLNVGLYAGNGGSQPEEGQGAAALLPAGSVYINGDQKAPVVMTNVGYLEVSGQNVSDAGTVGVRATYLNASNDGNYYNNYSLNGHGTDAGVVLENVTMIGTYLNIYGYGATLPDGSGAADGIRFSGVNNFALSYRVSIDGRAAGPEIGVNSYGVDFGTNTTISSENYVEINTDSIKYSGGSSQVAAENNIWIGNCNYDVSPTDTLIADDTVAPLVGGLTLRSRWFNGTDRLFKANNTLYIEADGANLQVKGNVKFNDNLALESYLLWYDVIGGSIAIDSGATLTADKTLSLYADAAIDGAGAIINTSGNPDAPNYSYFEANNGDIILNNNNDFDIIDSVNGNNGSVSITDKKDLSLGHIYAAGDVTLNMLAGTLTLQDIGGEENIWAGGAGADRNTKSIAVNAGGADRNGRIVNNNSSLTPFVAAHVNTEETPDAYWTLFMGKGINQELGTLATGEESTLIGYTYNPNFDWSLTANATNYFVYSNNNAGRTFTLTANSYGTTYGEALTVAADGFNVACDAEWSGNHTGSAFVSSLYTTTTNAGIYTDKIIMNRDTWTATDSQADDDYISVNGNLNVAKRPVAITTTAADRVYGSANVFGHIDQTGTEGSGSGLINGDYVASVEYYTNGGTTANAGFGYNAAVIGGTLGQGDVNNYDIQTTAASFTITQAPITFTGFQGSRTYGQENEAIVYQGTINGIMEWDSLALSGSVNDESITNKSNAGGYAAYANKLTAAVTGDAAANYYVSGSNLGNLAIGRAPITITGFKGSRTYGADNSAIAYQGALDGVMSWDSLGLVGSVNDESITNKSNAGGYAVYAGKLTATVSGTAVGNYYVVGSKLGNLAIGRAPITLAGFKGSRTYGQENDDITYQGTIAGAMEWDALALTGSVNDAAITSHSNAGGYAVYTNKLTAAVTGCKSANYYISGSNLGNLAIGRAPLTFVDFKGSRTYGADNSTIAYTGWLNGVMSWDALTIGTSVNDPTITSHSNAGGYATYADKLTATFGGAAAVNYYSVGNNLGSLAIYRAPITLTGFQGSRTYGQNNGYVDYQGTMAGVMEWDATHLTLGGNVNDAAITDHSNAGDYTVYANKLTAAVEGCASANYYVSGNSLGNLAIDRAPITFNGFKGSRTYGQDNEMINYQGTINGAMSWDSLAMSCSVNDESITSHSNAGGYAVYANKLTAIVAGDAAANYYVSGSNLGNLAIGRAPLTLTGFKGSRTYGADNNTITYQGALAGVMSWDSVGVGGSVNDLAITNQSNAGGYAAYANKLTAAVAGEAGGNYYISGNKIGSLAIGRAPITLSGFQGSRTYGQENTAIAYQGTMTGVMSWDHLNLGGSVNDAAITSHSNAGGYADYADKLTASLSGTPVGNYYLSGSKLGNLAIYRAPITFSGFQGSRTYGQDNEMINYQGTMSGAMAWDTLTMVDSVNDATITSHSNAGGYAAYANKLTATFAGAAAANYYVSGSNLGNLAIGRAPITFTGFQGSRTYGQDNSAIAYQGTMSGAMEWDTLTMVDSVNDATITNKSNAGGYAAYANKLTATFVGASAANYYVSGSNLGNLAIGRAPITFTGFQGSRIYGADNSTIAYEGTMSGAMSWDTLYGIGSVNDATITSRSNAGGYAVYADKLTAWVMGEGVANYYISGSNLGNLAIGRAPITFTGFQGSRTYGAENNTIAYQGTMSGAMSWDTLTMGGSVNDAAITNQSNAGGYAVYANKLNATFAGAAAANYYVSGSNLGNLAIGRAPITITGFQGSRTYGAENSTIAYRGALAGVMEWDSLSLGGSVNDATITSKSNVGSYADKLTAAISGTPVANYYISGNKLGNLAINQAPITFTGFQGSRTYGAENSTIGYQGTMTGVMEWDNLALSGSVNDESITNKSNAGGYAAYANKLTATFAGAAAANYYTSGNNLGNLAIGRAPITFTGFQGSRTYGQYNSAIGYQGTMSGAMSWDTLTMVGSVNDATITSHSNAGGYAAYANKLTATFAGAAAANYYTSGNNLGNLAIGRAPITFTGFQGSRTYGQDNSAIGYQGTMSGAMSWDTLTIHGSVNDATITNQSNAGGYAAYANKLTATIAGAAAANYYVSGSNLGNLAIGRAPITFTGFQGSRTYGQDNEMINYQGTMSGAMSWDTLTMNGSVNDATITSRSNAAVYTNKLTATVAGAAVANYYISGSNLGNLTINQAPITFTGFQGSRTYGQTNSAIVYQGTMTGAMNWDTLTMVDSVNDATITRYSNAGGYEAYANKLTATIAGAAAANYYVSGSNLGNLAIGRAPITFTGFQGSRTYGQTNSAIVYQGTMTGAMSWDTLTMNGSVNDATITNQSNAAVYTNKLTATVGGAAAANYYVSGTGLGNLAIASAPVTLSSFQGSRTYGAENSTIAYQGALAGVMEWDSLSVGGSVNDATITSHSNAGGYATYVNKLTAALTGTPAANYYISGNKLGNLSIGQAPITFTGFQGSRTYGAENSTIAYEGTMNGVMSWDNLVGVAGVNDATITSHSNAGGYAVYANKLTVMVMGTGVANYYISGSNLGNLAIGRAPVSFNAIGGARIYGDPNSTAVYTTTVTGVMPWDVVAGTVSVSNTLKATITQASNAGEYADGVTAGIAGTAATNYYIPAAATKTGMFIITPAQLSVTASNATKLYGAAVPVFTGTATGWKNSDGDQMLTGFVAYDELGALVTAASHVPYNADTISAAAATAGSNYTIVSRTDGSLQINPAPVVFDHADSVSMTTGPLPVFTGVATGWQPVNSDGNQLLVGFRTNALNPAREGVFTIYADRVGIALNSFGTYDYYITLDSPRINGVLTVTATPVLPVPPATQVPPVTP